jgi:hypothetical protein
MQNEICLLLCNYGNSNRKVYWILNENGKPSMQYVEADLFQEWQKGVIADGYSIKVIEK